MRSLRAWARSGASAPLPWGHFCMPTMTNEDVVRAVTAVTQESKKSPGALVKATDITEWCDRQRPPIDYGPGIPGARNKYFWEADLDEAGGKHRLLKFKESASRGSAVHLALRLKAKPAPARVSGHPGRTEARQRKWVECVWLPKAKKWDWENAKVPAP